MTTQPPEWTAARDAAADASVAQYKNANGWAHGIGREHFIEGASWARTFELERAKALVEALKRCYSNSITPTGTAHDAMIDAALAAYGGQRDG